MYANVFGQEGVEEAIEMLKPEIAIDAANIGVPDVGKIGPEAVSEAYMAEFFFNKVLLTTTGQLEDRFLWVWRKASRSSLRRWTISLYILDA